MGRAQPRAFLSSTPMFFNDITDTAIIDLGCGIAYALWAGAGTVLIALIGFFFYRQKLDAPAITGMALIVAGILVMNLFSKSAAQ